MTKRLIIFAGMLSLASGWCVPSARGQGSEVVVIYNTRMAESRDVAEHYAEMRHVPAEQVLGFDLTDAEVVSRAEFRDRLQTPLLKALADRKLFEFSTPAPPATAGEPRQITNGVSRARIRYAALCYGIPLRIAEDPELREPGAGRVQVELRRNGAAVDSELACLPFLAGNMPLTGPVMNALYGCTNAQLLAPANGVLLVTRLDGPTAAIARGLVDKALQAEAEGLWGRAYFDLRGITNGPYRLGDDQIRGASEICRQLGFETIVDERRGTFPSGFPLSQVAFYAGWYDANVSGPFARPTVEFMPGAFAYHLYSFSALTLRTTDREWVGPLLARGVTATMGCVDEPYLELTPDMAVFFDEFVNLGFSYGEAAYGCQRALSWQTTVVGDPLYRPFGRPFVERQLDLWQHQSKLREWACLRAANQRLVQGAPLPEVIADLEALPLSRQSAVLTEKLAELYSQAGRTNDAVNSLQQALKLGPSPQQRVRITLTLAARLAAAGRNQEAYDLYRQFLKQTPDYPDQLYIYRHLQGLAVKLGRHADAEDFEREITRLAPAPGLP